MATLLAELLHDASRRAGEIVEELLRLKGSVPPDIEAYRGDMELRHPLVRDHLEFHHRLVTGSVKLRRPEQAHIVRTPLMPHQLVDVPGRAGTPQDRYWGGTTT